MVHRKEKELLLRAFEAPKPAQKKVFLRELPRQEVSMSRLIVSQASYVRKRVWLVSVLALFCAAILTKTMSPGYIWLLSSLATCASASLVVELAKSGVYGMSELEASTRFSLRLILLARMSAIGIVHVVVLLIIIPFMGAGTGIEIWQKAAYIVVPYLLTAGLGVAAVREVNRKDSMLVCVALGIGVGVLFPGIQVCILPIYSEQYLMYWTICAFILLLWFVKQFKMTMRATENMV